MIQFISAVVERPMFDLPALSVVLFAESVEVLEVQTELMEAVDIVQARYKHDRFLIEVCRDTTEAELEDIDSVFRFDAQVPLYCIPFVKRDRLPDARFFAADFSTYCWLWKEISGEAAAHTDETPLELEEVLAEIYNTENFAFFRLVLSGQE